LWNNASLKKLIGGNIVRILREVSDWLSFVNFLCWINDVGLFAGGK
jgi:hypothetical protein